VRYDKSFWERALIPCFREVGQRDGQRDGLDFNNLSSFQWISAVGGFFWGAGLKVYGM